MKKIFLKVFNFIVFFLLIFSIFRNSQKLKFHILSIFYTPTMENLHFYSCSHIFRSSGQKGQKMLWGKKTDHLKKVNFKKTPFYFSFIFRCVQRLRTHLCELFCWSVGWLVRPSVGNKRTFWSISHIPCTMSQTETKLGVGVNIDKG